MPAHCAVEFDQGRAGEPGLGGAINHHGVGNGGQGAGRGDGVHPRARDLKDNRVEPVRGIGIQNGLLQRPRTTGTGVRNHESRRRAVCRRERNEEGRNPGSGELLAPSRERSPGFIRHKCRANRLQLIIPIWQSKHIRPHSGGANTQETVCQTRTYLRPMRDLREKTCRCSPKGVRSSSARFQLLDEPWQKSLLGKSAFASGAAASASALGRKYSANPPQRKGTRPTKLPVPSL